MASRAPTHLHTHHTVNTVPQIELALLCQHFCLCCDAVEVFVLLGYDASLLVFVSRRFEKMFLSHLQRSKCLLRTFRPSKHRTTNIKRCSVTFYLNYLCVNLCEYRPGFKL